MLPIRTCIILLLSYPAMAFQKLGFFQRQFALININENKPLHICSHFLHRLKYTYKDSFIYYDTKVCQSKERIGITGNVKMISSTVKAMKGAFTRKPAEVVKEGAISRPEVIVISGERVFFAKDLKEYDFAYFHCVGRNIRDVITKKEIADTDYLFAHEKKGELVLSHAGVAKAKLFFKEQWVLSHVPKLMPAIVAAIPDPSCNSIEDGPTESPEITLEEAPPFLGLKPAEKFKDVNGRVIEIEVRGERAHDLIYFKVKDVSAGFEMPNLHHVLIDTRKNYAIEVDYKYFIVNKCNKSTRKELFLTYSGLQKVIHTSRQKFGTRNIFIMTKWLQQFDNLTIDKYEIDINEDSAKEFGFVYCITSPVINGIKIGYWTGTLDALSRRYITYYGSNLCIDTAFTRYPRLLEVQCHTQFKDRNISNELYDKTGWKEYTAYMQSNIITDEIFMI